MFPVEGDPNRFVTETEEFVRILANRNSDDSIIDWTVTAPNGTVFRYSEAIDALRHE